jgi:hypothetical protein
MCVHFTFVIVPHRFMGGPPGGPPPMMRPRPDQPDTMLDVSCHDNFYDIIFFMNHKNIHRLALNSFRSLLFFYFSEFLNTLFLT